MESRDTIADYFYTEVCSKTIEKELDVEPENLQEREVDFARKESGSILHIADTISLSTPSQKCVRGNLRESR